MPGPFKTRKQLEKEYSFKKPRVFSNLGKNKLADAIRVITGKAPFKKKAKGGVVKMNMGGEVMDTTKSMPVGMMDGGKVKPMKMKMGGVIPGRGGMFKGIR